ncbi:M15 family metallopeptidase [Actinoplanes sp. N902-109]|uniref:M15 family metallopeptidase n=1 Tax=Actinoplanes sp. (strain N902-109) TaxID=649831 RepID=UPI000329581C|nr:M15 family metallopeptidase [Actinoplanes sp. N902-109]AGL17105.1 D-alanyl-D-alanine dipeptidase [Actinoplanes sp. N902-109]
MGISAAVTAVALAAAMAAQAVPVQPGPPPTRTEIPAGFVAVSRTDPSILHDIRYATNHNFVGRPVDGYNEPLCILTKPAATALSKAQRAVRKQGYTLKVYDCYRPQRAVDDFVDWAEDTADQRMKREFYPALDKSVLFDEGYIASKSGHSRGSTLDLTLVELPPRPQPAYRPGQPLVPCTAPAAQRFPDNSIDMGTGYDCFDTLANTLDPRVTGVAHTHRLLLKKAMTDAGFTNYDLEWWHYTLNDEPYPDTYFTFPVGARHR